MKIKVEDKLKEMEVKVKGKLEEKLENERIQEVRRQQIILASLIQ